MPLKIKFSRRPDPPPGEHAPAPPASAPAPVPAPAAPAVETPQPPRKLTLKIARKSQPETNEEKPKKKKSTKKRPVEGLAPPEPAPAPAPAPAPELVTSQQAPKRLKLNPTKRPGLQSIRIKNKGIVPNRPVGVGYDSEASDTENDPAIEEQFILRMLPGEDCEHLRKTINERTFHHSEFGFKSLTRDGRRAILKVRDKQYAAAMVDLPCIVEGMKSWDRRGWYKSADICQMLLVLGRVNSDHEAMEYPLPAEIDRPDEKTLQYPHGLAPPLRWVRKRRFRNRVSTRTIEQVEKAVEELMAQDETSIFPPKFELVDSASLSRAEGLMQAEEYEEYDEEQDAYGEAEDDMMDDLEDALAAEMEAALAAGDDDAAGAVLEQPDTPSMQPFTPAGGPTERGDTSADESNISDEDDDDAQDELDDDQIEQQQQLQQQREEVAELEAHIRTETAKWEQVQNHILRNKMGRRIQELRKDLELKKVSMGMPAGDDI